MAAARYSLTRNALHFLCETHLELPPQPAPGYRMLVLFAHFDPHGIVDPYVVYYLKALHGLGACIVFVSGSPVLTPESVTPIRSLCAGIYTRRTLSLDFGSWHLAWCILRDRGWSLDQFDRFIIVNDSVFGPLFPLEEMWDSFRGADMYGAIENTQMAPHLQAFLVTWELNSRTRPFLNDFWNDFHYVVHKGALIWRYEVGLSRRARKAGLTIKPFVSATAIKTAYGHSSSPPWIGGRSARNNGTLHFWNGLIDDFRFPFLKANLARYDMPWHATMAQLRDVIEQRTPYPYQLIQSNVDRVGRKAPPLISGYARPLARWTHRDARRTSPTTSGSH
ncbi:rhamnan synthesis F family protein [Mycobacterium arosiense]|uniref:rhamnan synthesis F family protein n=1 Tax=Mycobacterium arosiense TaxID=425468 RepID=UPI0013019F19|nr:rhamnan synthesis F family protein [Mycobacterium arosiense]